MTRKASIHLSNLTPALPAALAAVLLAGFAAGCRPPCAGLWLAEDSLCVPVRRLPVPAPEEKLGPLLRSRPGTRESFEVLVDLDLQADLPLLDDLLERRRAPRLERRRLTVAALETVAEEGWRQLEPLLRQLEKEGSLRGVRRYAVVSRWRLTATPEALRRLAARPQVARIRRRTVASAEAVHGAIPPRPPAADKRRSWALAAVGAERVWAEGLSGRGVVVGLIDSGASAVHEQLRGGFRGGETSWYDPRDGLPSPADSAYGHGSGVLSVAVGRNAAGVILGVAPDARWIACAGLPDGHYDNVLMTECADWMLRVGQPDVLINAWLLPEDGCDPSFLPILEAWRTAEILPVFAAGNLGPAAGTNRSPANYGGLYPGGGRTLSVGGLGRGGELFDRSARGPSSCDGGRFPSLVAPAEDLVTALPLTRSAYLQGEGTSYAAGLVAGAAALLLEHHPEASVPELEAALRQGAADLGPPGPDDAFGHGRLDIPAALERLDRRP